MRLFDHKAAKRITALLTAAALLVLLPPSRYASAAGTYTAVDEEPFYWTEDLSTLQINNVDKERGKHFAEHLVSDSALMLGMTAYRGDTYFISMEKTGFMFPLQNVNQINESGLTTPEDFKPYIIRNVETFTVNRIPYSGFFGNSVRYFYSVYQGVLFDLYTYDGQRIGFDLKSSDGKEVARSLSNGVGGLNATQTAYCSRALEKFYEIDLHQAGPNLGMPAGYSFALFDLYTGDKRLVMPTVGEVTRNTRGEVTDFRPVAMLAPLNVGDGKDMYQQTACMWIDVGDSAEDYYKLISCALLRLDGNYDYSRLNTALSVYEWIGLKVCDSPVYMDIRATKKVSVVTTITGEYVIEQSMQLGTALIIRNRSKLVIRSGATLSLTGTIVNEGDIIIEPGASLIVCSGGGIQTVDPFHPTAELPDTATHYGLISCQGDLAVLAGGYVITPGESEDFGISGVPGIASIYSSCYSGIECTGGSLSVAGDMMIGTSLFLAGAQLQVAPGGTLLLGMMTDKPYDASDFAKARAVLTQGNNHGEEVYVAGEIYRILKWQQQHDVPKPKENYGPIQPGGQDISDAAIAYMAQCAKYSSVPFIIGEAGTMNAYNLKNYPKSLIEISGYTLFLCDDPKDATVYYFNQ